MINNWDKVFTESPGKDLAYPDESLIRFVSQTLSNKIQKRKIKILEIGCGTGSNLWYLSKKGYSVYGIDSSKKAIFLSKARCKKEKVKCKIRFMDAAKLQFKDNFFDMVLDIECLYSNSYENTKLILDEIFRVLKKDGTFFSKTFATGMKYLKKNKNWYTSKKKLPLFSEHNLFRLTKESDIKKIYSNFKNLNWEYLHRTVRNRKYVIKEWLIYGKK